LAQNRPLAGAAQLGQVVVEGVLVGEDDDMGGNVAEGHYSSHSLLQFLKIHCRLARITVVTSSQHRRALR
jgi:hypothetical protein